MGTVLGLLCLCCVLLPTVSQSGCTPANTISGLSGLRLRSEQLRSNSGDSIPMSTGWIHFRSEIPGTSGVQNLLVPSASVVHSISIGGDYTLYYVILYVCCHTRGE